jgi:uncharacterized damage-inducible protein DinB
VKNTYLNPILKEAAELPSKLQEVFGSLTAEQLNWKPNPATWSIGECIDHLINTNRSYFAQLEAISRGDKYESFWEKLPLFHKFWGKTLLNATSDVEVKKGKSPRPFKPVRSTVATSILDEFALHQKQLISKVESTDKVDHHKTMITSPAAAFITYSLHDALLIIFQHERRHFNQAKSLMAMTGFPKS